MYTLAKHLTTQNLTLNSFFRLIWNIATFVINTDLHQNDLKINNVVFLFVLDCLRFLRMLFFNYSALINMINASPYPSILAVIKFERSRPNLF